MLHIELEPNEKIVLEIRKHWFVILGPALLHIVAAIAPIILFVALRQISPEIKFAMSTEQIFLLKFFFYPLWLLLVWLSVFVAWTNYYLDVWYITEKRIIDIEQKGIFHREISNLPFEKIQDVSVEVRGLIATFLNFGTVHVQTASENSNSFVIPNAVDPEKIKSVIFSLHNIRNNGLHATTE